MFNEFKKKEKICFYCPLTPELWDENSINSSISGRGSGIGGSETQVILLSRELAKLNYKVTVFNSCLKQHTDFENSNVEYIPINNFDKSIYFDHFICQRSLINIDHSVNFKNLYVMAHDVFVYHIDFCEGILNKVKNFFCLSSAHKNSLVNSGIPEEKILMTSNGIDMKRYETIDERKRERYKIIYTSSLNRGLDVLLDFYPFLKSIYPHLNLHIYYGNVYLDKNYFNFIMNKISKLKDVYYHGRVGQNELADVFKTSRILAYPCHFTETFCITILEALAGGTGILTNKYWGIKDTLKDCGISIDIKDDVKNIYTKEYENKFTEYFCQLIEKDDLFYNLQKKGYERVKRFEWKSVANQWDNLFRNNNWSTIQI